MVSDFVRRLRSTGEKQEPAICVWSASLDSKWTSTHLQMSSSTSCESSWPRSLSRTSLYASASDVLLIHRNQQDLLLSMRIAADKQQAPIRIRTSWTFASVGDECNFARQLRQSEMTEFLLPLLPYSPLHFLPRFSKSITCNFPVHCIA